MKLKNMTPASSIARRIAKIPLNLTERLARRLKRTSLSHFGLGRTLIDMLLFPSDIWKIRSRFRQAHGYLPSLLRPQTFSERILYLKLFNRKRRYIQFADKLAVRDFVGAKIGSQYLPKTYWSGTDVRLAKSLPLPDKFVVKPNHSSGVVVIVRDASRLDWEALFHQTTQWLNFDLSMCWGEWQYRWIPPQIYIEEFLEDHNGSIPIDYKLFCFHGRVELVQVDIDRFVNHTRSLFDSEFNLLNVGLGYPRGPRIERPQCFELMRDIAEGLAAGEDFVRVDLYDLGRPVFGELTLSPGAGFEIFDPPDLDLRLGRILGHRPSR